jgi:hypothetical protein
MPYPGGKGGMGVAQRIINLMPPHEVYIEPFLGDATVMRLKRPASMNIGFDLDPAAPGLTWLARRAEESIPSCYWGGNVDGIQYLETRQLRDRTLGLLRSAVLDGDAADWAALPVRDERERIARKKRRWVERLRKMPVLERETLLAAIAEYRDERANPGEDAEAEGKATRLKGY